jgi:ribosomal protein L7/L12
MDNTTIIVIGAVLVGVIIGWLLARLMFQNKASSSLQQQQAELGARQAYRRPSFNTLPDDEQIASRYDDLPLEELEALLQRKRKIEAIKLFRQYSGVGLKEAKDVVDGMDENLKSYNRMINPAAIPNMAALEEDPQMRDEVLGYLQQGQKMKAIKLLRQHSGLSLLKTLEIIEALDTTIPSNRAEQLLDDEKWATIRNQLQSGNKIQAIKLYREYTGSDLLSAKHAIDALVEEIEN